VFTIYLVMLGLLVFAAGVGILGVSLRKYPSKDNEEKTSRIAHFLFFAGMVTPWRTVFFILGIALAIPGLYYLGITNKLLRALGSGANAFRLTRQIVADDIYKWTRNPMSLGFYITALALSFVSGSSLVTAFVLLGLIPAHLFFLKYFEELELELRFGESYLEYKKRVPFLIPSFTLSKKS
jgi:protein-S-isoprenylcysteine O-methyltransferase Ste14